MSKIKKISLGGEVYDCGGDAGIILTKAEYDALSEEEKNNGTMYFVPDDQTTLSGSNIVYNGPVDANNITGAIDVLNDTITNNTLATITFSDADLQCTYGGFVKIGNIVIVNATLAFKNSKTKFSGITSNMPIPKNDINLLLSNWNDDQHSSHYFGIEGNTEIGGNIYTNIPAATNKSLVLTGCYVCR